MENVAEDAVSDVAKPERNEGCYVENTVDNEDIYDNYELYSLVIPV